MDDFRGEPEQIEALRRELTLLEKKGYKSGRLENFTKEEVTYLRAARKDWMSRPDIDKFKKNEVKKPGGRRLEVLWNVVYSGRYPLPSVKKPQSVDTELQALAGPHGFFHACARFFRVPELHNDHVKQNLPGRFAFYHFSEIFHKFSPTLPRAVLVGQWDIDLIDGVYSVTERQA